MAYFKHNEPQETRRNSILSPEQEYETGYQPEYDSEYGLQTDENGALFDDEEYDEYDDGFDEPEAEEYQDEELTEEEKQEQKKDRVRMLFGAGDLTGIIAGTVVILLLLAFLFQMINFVRDDIHEFFDTIGRFFM